MNREKLRNTVFTGLFTAMVFISTYVIKIQTPTMGYIHPGDGIVLLAGILLGPLYGGFAAGVGSMLSDLVGGYLYYVPATLLIKGLTAVIASLVFRQFEHVKKTNGSLVSVIAGGITGELFMVFGYFSFELLWFGLINGDGITRASIISGVMVGISGIPFNVLQGLFGVLIVSVLYPMVSGAFASSRTLR